MSVGHRDVDVPLRPGSMSDLRHWARNWLDLHPTSVDADAVVLAMTEVVTNSARHGAPPVSVELVEDPPRLRMEVSDGSDVLPRTPGLEADQEGGRGLVILESLAASWGVTLRGRGKTLWCLFEARSGPTALS
jgi:anti-sigma regulatory factor (Ser/Thr protein kinase)